MTHSAFVIASSPCMSGLASRVASLIQAKYGLTFPHIELDVQRFANKEVLVHIPETVRGQHVFFFQGLQDPDPNNGLMTMLIANDTFKRASAASISLVIPYIPYLRQDRKHKARVPITARLVADLIESNHCVRKVITMDMHADQEQGFFSIPVDNLSSSALFVADYIRHCNNDLADVVALAPDFGSAVRVRRFAEKLGVPVAVCEKRRPKPNIAEILNVIGEDITGKRLVCFDDMIDTGGSIRSVISALRARNVQDVRIYATHGIFSADAEASFAEANMSVVCTDSIPRSEAYYAKHASWLTPVSADTLLADAIYEASLVGGSISKLNT